MKNVRRAFTYENEAKLVATSQIKKRKYKTKMKFGKISALATAIRYRSNVPSSQNHLPRPNAFELFMEV